MDAKQKTQQIPVKQEKNEKTNYPEQKFRAGSLTATVWKNSTIKDNNVVEFRTVSFERGYQDKDGVWKSTNNLRVNDLPKAVLVLGKAYEYLSLKESEGVQI